MSLVAVEENFERRCKQIEQLEALQHIKGPQPSTRIAAIAQFHRMYEHCPFPAWIKDASFTMLSQNPAYSELYARSARGQDPFVGKEDQVWGEKTAKEFHKQDAEALRSGYVITHEVIYNPVTRQRERLLGAKWDWEIGCEAMGTKEMLIVGIVTGNIPEPESARLDGSPDAR